MATAGPEWLTDAEACAETILSRVGKDIVLGLPLGLGKANSIANALYERAVRDPSISLKIFTALTLGRPRGKTDLERRFLDPLFGRLCGNYPELAYNSALTDGSLPPNIAVHEFFFPAGRRLSVPAAQQGYTSTNYTHAARDLLEAGVNVVAQLVAKRGHGDNVQLSLSCNPDITLDLLPELKKRQDEGQDIVISAQVNEQLPFMLGPAVVGCDAFDVLLHGPDCQFDLFAVPKQPVSLRDHASALHVASLIEDGGTLQIGIGGFADAVAHALKLRQHHNDRFQELVGKITSQDVPEQPRHLETFQIGLYANSEMLVEGLLELRRAGILKRRVSGVPGTLIHAAFFLGSNRLYRELRELSESELADIAMTSVSFVNQLYGDEQTKRSQRLKARFVNNALMVTALGAVISDGLDDGRIVSGVGGQYNFVAQAHELAGARSIIALDATRTERGRTTSNIVWSYAHTTIPRHLRDIVVTEYGVADLRGKSDRDVVATMLNIADSRFQQDLLNKAERAGKIEAGYEIPSVFRANVPAKIDRMLEGDREEGLLPPFPLGTEMTAVEQRLVPVLQALKSIAHSKPRLLGAAAVAALGAPPSTEERQCLQRLALDQVGSATERLTRWSILWALRQNSWADNRAG